MVSGANVVEPARFRCELGRVSNRHARGAKDGSRTLGLVYLLVIPEWEP